MGGFGESLLQTLHECLALRIAGNALGEGSQTLDLAVLVRRPPRRMIRLADQLIQLFDDLVLGFVVLEHVARGARPRPAALVESPLPGAIGEAVQCRRDGKGARGEELPQNQRHECALATR